MNELTVEREIIKMESIKMRISYRDAFGAWEDFDKLVDGLAHQVAIAEIGAGANPMLSQDLVNDRGITYHLLDESAVELEKAGPGYQYRVIDMMRPMADAAPVYDLLIARMTLEHIAHPAIFFQNAHRLLKPGGRFALFYACPTNLPMFVNKILPEAWSDRILKKIQPFRKQEKHGKFRAFYRWCYGPTRKNFRRLKGAGFSIETYTGFFGHSYYQRFRLLNEMENAKKRFLLKHPDPWLCTYAQLVLVK